MKNFDTVEAILDFAIKAEIEAFEFYKDLASKVESPTMKQVFLDFADEELEHKAKLEKSKAKKSLGPTHRNIPDMKISEYTADVEPTANMDYQSALILAMKREQKACQLYRDLAEIAESEPAKQTFLVLAEEEAKHKLRFETEYDQVVLKED